MPGFPSIANFVTKATKVNPLFYLFAYLLTIPIYAIFYVFVVPHDFYAPYVRYEPEAIRDRIDLAGAIKNALQRSFAERAGQKFVVANFEVEPDSLHVFNVNSFDGTQVTFTVQLEAHDVGGTSRRGWSFNVTAPEQGGWIVRSFQNHKDKIAYRFPECDLQRYVSPFREQTDQLFRLIFGQSDPSFLAPALVLNADEDARFARYLRGFRGDPGSVGGQYGRMIYFSAVVITTLGLGDIVPMTPLARGMVALEAIFGIGFAGFFLNALAYRASKGSP